jgi:hypothetical protein
MALAMTLLASELSRNMGLRGQPPFLYLLCMLTAIGGKLKFCLIKFVLYISSKIYKYTECRVSIVYELLAKVLFTNMLFKGNVS